MVCVADAVVRVEGGDVLATFGVLATVGVLAELVVVEGLEPPQALRAAASMSEHASVTRMERNDMCRILTRG